MPCISTALNVLNFIIVVKGGNSEILKPISITWTAPKLQCWGNGRPRLRLLLNHGHLSQNHSRPSCACSAAVSLLVGNRATLLVPLFGFFCGCRKFPWRDQPRPPRPRGLGSCQRSCVHDGRRTSAEKSGSWRVPRWLQKGKCLPRPLKHGLFSSICVPNLCWSLSCQATKGLPKPNPN